MQHPHLVLFHFVNNQAGYECRRGCKVSQILFRCGFAVHINGKVPWQGPEGTTSPYCHCPASPGASPVPACGQDPTSSHRTRAGLHLPPTMPWAPSRQPWPAGWHLCPAPPCPVPVPMVVTCAWVCPWATLLRGGMGPSWWPCFFCPREAPATPRWPLALMVPWYSPPQRRMLFR